MENNKLLKHIKRATGNSDRRPILKCAHYNADGSINATDSHRLLRINNFHKHEASFNLNVRTLELSDEVYPDVLRLIPSWDDMHTKIETRAEILLPIFKSFDIQHLGATNVHLEINRNGLMISNPWNEKTYDVNFKTSLQVKFEGEPIKIACPLKLLIHAADFMNDIGNEKGAVVEIGFISPILPFLMRKGDYEYLVTPVRIFE